MSPRLLYLLSAQRSLVDPRDRRDARLAARRYDAACRNGLPSQPVWLLGLG